MQLEWLNLLQARWRALWNRKQLDQDLQDELNFHLAMKTETGQRDFGNAAYWRETTRESWTFAAMEGFWKDLRFGARGLVKRPGFAILATLTLALGIGANTSIFSVANTVLLRPLPYPGSESIVSVWETSQSSMGSMRGSLCLERYRAWREQNQALDALAVFQSRALVLKSGTGSSRVTGIEAGAGLFGVLGTPPLLGRTFAEGEDAPGHNHVAVLSYAYWQRRFGGRRDVAGTTISMDDGTYTVIGVMPPEFQFPLFWNTAIWIPFATPPTGDQGHSMHRYQALARLKPGIGLEQAQRSMDALTLRMEQDTDEKSRRGIFLSPLLDDYVGWLRPVIATLCGAVAFVLLIATANVANLLLARALGRRSEVAVRAALGARRGRLIRQFLTESLILAVAGGALGLLLARWMVRAIQLTPYNIPRLKDVALDWQMLAICGGVSMAAALLCGMLPAIQVSRTDLNLALKDTSRTASSKMRLRAALAAGEVALTIVLLTGAGLMLRSLWQLQNVKTGFATEHLLTMRLPLAPSRYKTTQAVTAFDRAAVEAAGAVPGVNAAGMISLLPPNENGTNGSFEIAGRAPQREADRPFAEKRIVSPGYFSAMGIPLVRGRFLTEHDDANAPVVGLINQALAKLYFPNQDPVGFHIKYDERLDITIAGLVADVKNRGLRRSSAPELYLSYLQIGVEERPNASNMWLIVRSAATPTALTSAVRSVIRKIDAVQSIAYVQTMDDVLDASAAQPRFQSILLGAFGGLALLISTIGLYGVIAYGVGVRRHEIGVRMALGASRGQVVGMILGQGMSVAALGVALGLMGALATTRLIRGFLFEVSPADPATFAAVAALVAAAAMLGAYIPARRATRVDPTVALRHE